MIKESFFVVDNIAQKENSFSRVDARVKVSLAMLSIALLITLPGNRLPVLIFLAALLSFKIMQVPWKLLIARLLPPLLLSSVVVFLDTFMLGRTNWFQLNIGPWLLTGHSEGFYLGLHLFLRVLGSVSIILGLGFSTPINELLLAASWFKVPRVLVEVFMLTYRYLFVFWDEGIRIRNAQTLRLGYPQWKQFSMWKKAMKSTSTLMGMILIRAYDRAESTYQAMQIRGYKGRIAGSLNHSWSGAQWKYSFLGLTILLALVTVSYI